MRQINRLAQALGKLLADLIGLKCGGQVGEIIETTNQALINELNIDIDGLIAIPAMDFLNFLLVGRKFNNESLGKLADIFLFLADNSLYQKGDIVKRKQLYSKCLTILEYLDKTETTYMFDQNLKIDRIKKLLLQANQPL